MLALARKLPAAQSPAFHKSLRVRDILHAHYARHPRSQRAGTHELAEFKQTINIVKVLRDRHDSIPDPTVPHVLRTTKRDRFTDNRRVDQSVDARRAEVTDSPTHRFAPWHHVVGAKPLDEFQVGRGSGQGRAMSLPTRWARAHCLRRGDADRSEVVDHDLELQADRRRSGMTGGEQMGAGRE